MSSCGSSDVQRAEKVEVELPWVPLSLQKEIWWPWEVWVGVLVLVLGAVGGERLRRGGVEASWRVMEEGWEEERECEAEVEETST